MSDELTPMMKQYRGIKAGLASDVILFFRLGDFYEMFFEDAQTAAPILDISLTKRNKVPMCGVPFHAVDNYLAKLIRAGKKVAICEQVEDASATKGIVRREVTRVVTPGTVIEDGLLESNRHNYLAGVCKHGEGYGFALLDLSTGLFMAEEVSDLDALCDNLRRFSPDECVVPAEQAEKSEFMRALNLSLHAGAGKCDDWVFEYDAAYDCLVRHFGVHSLAGFGCDGNRALVGAAGGVLYYVREDLSRDVSHVRSLRVRSTDEFLLIDEATCTNLDLVPLTRGRTGESLLKVLDATRTAMGARKLRDWILRPLSGRESVARRHDVVEEFFSDRLFMNDVREALGEVRDMERLITRISAGSGNARDLAAIGRSLAQLPDIKGCLSDRKANLVQELNHHISTFPELVDLIESAIVDEPPITIKEGGMIRDGYNHDLDELKKAAAEGRSWLAEYQVTEQQRTGIKTLKVRHNRVFGFYIEISKGQLGNVPPEYIRKQTMVNGERYITPELKDYENRIMGAQDKAIALEYELFQEIRKTVIAETEHVQLSADALAALDVLSAFADRALAFRYVRPVMTDGDALKIKDSRHPVIEQMSEAERFVPNDVMMDCTSNQLMIITGPNMAGKSTYIRQVAIVVIMAHIGSFVPAAEAEIGMVDRVFTRVGASDDIARGRSTFMVEMQETANILNNATPRSLIVLDEIGRGTSTFDGISIAWAVAEYLHNNLNVKAKTLFATHYHELTELALTMSGVKNYNILVKERDDKIAFLRKIVPGAADKSYGIQVARLAGMPQEVIDRSKEILSNLEEGELGESGQPKIAKKRKKKDDDSGSQLAFF